MCVHLLEAVLKYQSAGGTFEALFDVEIIEESGDIQMPQMLFPEKGDPIEAYCTSRSKE